jgi:histidyl-tRNA synthetase
MCLFASQDGNGGYIDLTINEISGKTVKINSITVTYFKLTNANPTVIVGGNELAEGKATIKNMIEGTQESVEFALLPEKLA